MGTPENMKTARHRRAPLLGSRLNIERSAVRKLFCGDDLDEAGDAAEVADDIVRGADAAGIAGLRLNKPRSLAFDGPQSAATTAGICSLGQDALAAAGELLVGRVLAEEPRKGLGGSFGIRRAGDFHFDDTAGRQIRAHVNWLL